jgi:ectoine hydroxylase-related dioxygenase (phytanoyl-CoA dioxygenase family)
MPSDRVEQAPPALCQERSGAAGLSGYRTDLAWSAPEKANELAQRLAGRFDLGEVTRNLHLTEAWARDAVAGHLLIPHVQAMIGPAVAVENTFLVIKRPGGRFEVPPHQDGINDWIVLDPARSVAVWLAITDATVENGCLEVAPGSHAAGYLPYGRAADTGAGTPLTASLEHAGFAPVPLPAGGGCAMDVRLLHRSRPNRSSTVRVGLNIRYVAPGGLTVRGGSSPHLHVVSGDSW